MVDIELKYLPVIGLVAAVPVVLFALQRSQPFVFASLLNLLLIMGSLYYIFTRKESAEVSTAE